MNLKYMPLQAIFFGISIKGLLALDRVVKIQSTSVQIKRDI
jgi:hypothetical protein